MQLFTQKCESFHPDRVISCQTRINGMCCQWTQSHHIHEDNLRVRENRWEMFLSPSCKRYQQNRQNRDTTDYRSFLVKDSEAGMKSSAYSSVPFREHCTKNKNNIRCHLNSHEAVTRGSTNPIFDKAPAPSCRTFFYLF